MSLASRPLARWVSRCPMDTHFSEKIMYEMVYWELLRFSFWFMGFNGTTLTTHGSTSGYLYYQKYIKLMGGHQASNPTILTCYFPCTFEQEGRQGRVRGWMNKEIVGGVTGWGKGALLDICEIRRLSPQDFHFYTWFSRRRDGKLSITLAVFSINCHALFLFY